jgi:prepilin-type N-terminal cleavage/methylation domain-containing protein
MHTKLNSDRGELGFSLIELMIAMTLTLIIAGASATLLGQSFRMRSREDVRSDAIADAQRALNIVSREIANSGFGLLDNGIVPGDTNNESIRIRANLNAYTSEEFNQQVKDPDEDIKYLMYHDAENRHYLVRLDASLAATDPRKKTVLANRLDFFRLQYFDGAGAEIIPADNPANLVNTWKVRILVGVTMPAEGRHGDPGFQREWPVTLHSDVVLRNVSQITY